LDDFENNLKKRDFRSWRKISRDGDAWKLILKKARVLREPYSHRREK
jgi:hypothetical protein